MAPPWGEDVTIFFGPIWPRRPTDLLQGDFGNQHSKSIMDYVFSHFTGIFLMAAFALVLYVPWT